tara:strand:+ start:104 stop:457 length:354 start_codon:yes stop_codon:yes gene_type:complete
MQKENYLYFAEASGDINATGTQGMWPTSAFLGVDSLTTGTTNVYFKDQTGTAAHDVITVTHTTSANKEFHKAICRAVNNPKGKFIAVADEANGVYTAVDNYSGAAVALTTVEVAITQ